MKINDTLRFVLPMLYNKTKGLNNDFFFNPFFIGAFTADFYKPEYDDNSIILVYKNNFTEEFSEFERKLISVTHIVDVYTIDEQDLIVYVIDMPEEFENDYVLISTGNYDQLSPELKLNIFKFWLLNTEDGLAKVLVGEKEYEGESFEEQTFKLN